MHALPPPILPPAYVFVQAIPGAPAPPRYLRVEARNADVTPERSEILARARMAAAERGWTGNPVIIEETETPRGLAFLVEFRPVSTPSPGFREFRDPNVSQSLGGDAQPREGGVAPRPAGPSVPRWVLVLPVDESQMGAPIWGRATEWGRAWTVPRRHSGVRMVSTVGDSEDRETLPRAALSSPTADQLGRLARKYGAPAVAMVAQQRDGSVRAWVYRGGSLRTGDAGSAADAEGRVNAAADLVRRLMGSSDEGVATAADERISPMLRVTAFRANGQGGTAVILCDTSDADEHAEARRLVRRLTGFLPISYRTTDEGLVISGTWTTGDLSTLEQALNDAGGTVIR